MKNKIATIVVTGTVFLSLGGCGQPYQDTRCEEIESKLVTCDPRSTNVFVCSPQMLDT